MWIISMGSGWLPIALLRAAHVSVGRQVTSQWLSTHSYLNHILLFSGRMGVG